MKMRNRLAALLLGTALLLGGCGKAAPENGGTEPEKGVSSEAETAENGERKASDAPEKGDPAPPAADTAENGEPENPVDAGQSNAGQPDAGEPDIGEPDAGETDAERSGHAGEDVYAEKIALVSGTWYTEDGTERLVVRQDGGFTLYSPDGGVRYAGWLSYTEEDGTGQWETGPRYELYTEDGGNVPETYLSVEEDRPGEIAFCEGGGAVAFQYDGPAPEVQTRAVRVRMVTEEETLPEHDTFTAYEGEYPVRLLFYAVEPVTDFRFLSLSYSDMEADSLPAFDVVELYDGGTLDRPLLVTTSFPGDIPTNGFTYLDAAGEPHHVSISESGYDGSLVTGDFHAYYG